MATFRKSLFVNAFGALGYISNLTQWMWTLLIVAYPLLTTGSTWSLPEPSTAPGQDIVLVPTGPFAIVLTAIITAVIIVLTIYTLLVLPRTVGKAGAKVTRRVASATIPVVTQHKKISKKERTKLSYRITLSFKFISAILPAMLVIALPSVAPIDHSAAVGAAVFFSLVTCMYFLLQYGFGHALKVDRTTIW